MKTTRLTTRMIAIVAVALFIWVSTPTMAQSGTEVLLLPYKGDRVVLKISNPEQDEPLALTIKDAEGSILFQEQIEEEKFEQVFDFSVAGKGAYIFDLNHGGDLVRSTLSVDENGLITGNFADTGGSAYAFSKDIRTSDNKLMVRFKNKLEESMTLKIYDSKDDTLLYEEEGISAAEFAKSYDFSKLKKGVYSISLSGNTYSYYYDVDLR